MGSIIPINFFDKNIIPIACSGYAEKNNIDAKLKEMNYEYSGLSGNASEFAGKNIKYLPR